MCNVMARQGYIQEYLYRGSAGAIDRVMLIGVRRQCIQPANLAVEYRPLCISNGVPGISGGWVDRWLGQGGTDYTLVYLPNAGQPMRDEHESGH